MNVIWIISDTLRRDALGIYGNKVISTPSLDKFAEKSIRFDRHYAAGFPTMPTRADFATGRWTFSYIQWGPLPPNQVTLAQLLAKKGVHTAAVVDTPFYIGGGMNYDRGFESFHYLPGQAENTGYGRDLRAQWRSELDCFAPRTFLAAMKWLERHYKENFFLCIDTWDPHEPFEAPEYYTELYWPNYDGEIINPPYARWQDVMGWTEEKVKKGLATYWGEVTMVDTWVGHLLRQLEIMNLMGNTSIIFTSDHGYHFGEHGGLFGKMVANIGPDEKLVPIKEDEMMMPVSDDEAPLPVPTPFKLKKIDASGEITNEKASGGGGWAVSPLYEELAAVPLLIYTPNTPSGTYHGLTSAVDLMPTVLDMMDHSIPSFVEGHSLLPAVKNPSIQGRDFVVTTSSFANPGEQTLNVDGVRRPLKRAPMTTITTKEWSLLYNIEPELSELYNLKTDPKQEKNVISENLEIARELHQLLVNFMHETNVSPERIKLRLELRL